MMHTAKGIQGACRVCRLGPQKLAGLVSKAARICGGDDVRHGRVGSALPKPI